MMMAMVGTVSFIVRASRPVEGPDDPAGGQDCDGAVALKLL